MFALVDDADQQYGYEWYNGLPNKIFSVFDIHHDDISGTKRGIIDLLVSKRMEKIWNILNKDFN